MTDPAPAPAEPALGRARRRRLPTRMPRWRVFAVATFVAAGSLFVTSAVDSRAGALRTSGVVDLQTVVAEQRADTDDLQRQVADLNRQVGRLSRNVDDAQVKKLQGQADAVKAPAGLRPVTGPGLVVSLQDAPDDVIRDAIADPEGIEPEKLIVHQQDIQAVVNALWVGGAQGISIQDQRIISTTGIKCAGPTVILHGVPYSPPYVVKAVGDPTRLAAAIDASSWIDSYRVVADDYGLGFAEQASGELEIPGYQGTLELQHAKVLAGS